MKVPRSKQIESSFIMIVHIVADHNRFGEQEAVVRDDPIPPKTKTKLTYPEME